MGTTNTGHWVNGVLEGWGEEEHPDSSKYTGEFKGGKKSGKGTYIWADMSKYIGDWKNNLIDG